MGSSYGKNHSFDTSRPVGPTGRHAKPDQRQERLVEVLQAQLKDLSPDETPLSRVTVSGSGRNREYVIRDAAGSIIGTLTDDDLDANEPTATALRKAVSRIMCTDCGRELLAGESGLCGPCEGAAIRDLLELAAESDDA